MSFNTLSQAVSTTPSFSSSGIYSGGYPEPARLNTINQIYQPVKVYIEGVEVPYVSISINQAMKQLPSCEIEVPPIPGLMEITRYYQPKIHIFYEDQDLGGDRLLFWGHLCGSVYSKNRAGSGYTSIRFRARHKSQVLNDIILFYGNPMENGLDVKVQGTTVATDSLTSAQSAATALRGITGPRTKTEDEISPFNTSVIDADVTKLPDSVAAFEKRLVGTPGALVNLWNQLKKACCKDANTHMNMLAMYIPLFEEGLSYLKRMSGHYLVENYQQTNRIQYCPDPSTDGFNVMVPSFYSTSSQSAVETYYAINVVTTGLGAAGETTTFLQLCEMFYDSLMYEIITLASPAEVPVDPSLPYGEAGEGYCAVETIVKPTMPFYYSPICNVIFPRMFTAIDITQDDDSVPTRVTAQHSQLPTTSTNMDTFFRGPSTIREALSFGKYFVKGSNTTKKYDLSSTTAADTNVPGKYEQGIGIRHMNIHLPWWLVLLVKNFTASGKPDQSWPPESSSEYFEMLVRMKDWEQRYAITHNSDGTVSPDFDKDSLDPNSPKSDVFAYQSMLFNAVDYEFTKTVVGSRQGTISCVFNPYIIPGYPMDVLDDSPNAPSFHGLCSSVTHSITASSISTTVGIVAAVSYSELSMYYIPPLHPRLMSQLGMFSYDTTNLDYYKLRNPPYGDATYIGDVNSGLLQNPDAKNNADQFYYSVLGVGAADPSTLYDFVTSQPFPQMRLPGDYKLNIMANGSHSLPDENGGDRNDWLTVPGNLRLVSRPIEGKDSISAKFEYDFIDLTEENYSGSWMAYSNPALASPRQLEPGASMFLDYKEVSDFILPLSPSDNASTKKAG